MSAILLLNGPNLNRLGTREPVLYGVQSLAEIEQHLMQQASAAGHRLSCLQSNSEATLIERVHQAGDDGVQYILLNPAALTHTSIALRDALLAVAIPFIEIHLSNVHAREEFRHRSYFSDVAVGVISGFGPQGYVLALDAVISQLATSGQA